MTSPLSPDQQTATQIIQAQLDAWGLGALSGKLNDLIRQGLNSDAITLQLRATPEYKTRFAANTARVKNGLPELTPAQYIATEASYRQVMQSYGLPSTFYDSQDDYRKFLEADVSPDEIKSRAQVAQQIWLTSDPQTKAVWRDFYGLSDGAAIASILDPQRALPVVQTMAQTAQAGAAARNNGLVADQGRLTQYIDQGYTVDQLTKDFSDIGAAHPVDQAIASRFGTTFDQAQEEAASVQGLASARRKQQLLYDSERALFTRRGGADATTENVRSGGSY